MTSSAKSNGGAGAMAGEGSLRRDELLFRTACEWRDAGHGVALAFVMSTWGSSPRQPGSVMIIRDDMKVEGSVSGGCVEGAVIEAGLNAMSGGVGQRLEFGVSDAMAWEVGLSCGGRIEVLVTPVGEGGVDDKTLGQIAHDIEGRIPIEMVFATGAAGVAGDGVAVAAGDGAAGVAVDGATDSAAGQNAGKLMEYVASTPIGRSGPSEDGARFS